MQVVVSHTRSKSTKAGKLEYVVLKKVTFIQL